MSDEIKEADGEASAISKFDLENASTVIDLRSEPASVSGPETADQTLINIEPTTDSIEVEKQLESQTGTLMAAELHSEDIDVSIPTQLPPPSEPPRDEIVEVVTAGAKNHDSGFPWLHVGVSIVSTALVCLGLFTLYSDALLGRIEVDNFVGMELEEVEIALADSSIVIETQEGRLDGTDVGEIIEQRPREGSTLGPGDVLLLTVSQGSELIGIPEVSGVTLQEAQDIVSSRGFEVGEIVEERDSATVPRGNVIELVVSGAAVDGEVPSGTAVDFIVSNGLVTIPRVTAEEIESVLIDRLDLVVEIEERFEQDSEAGEVLETFPATGTKVTPGSSVTVVIALDEPQEEIDIPNVIGDDVFEAVEDLQNDGFRVVLDSSPPDGNCNRPFDRLSQDCRRFFNGEVWDMNPRRDAFPGSEIRLFVSPDAANAFNNSQNN